MKSMRRVVVLGAMVCSVLPLASQAQESTAAFPARPVTLVVPAQPGASFDITARLYAQKLGDSLRQPVVLEHKPGAGGTIAYAHVAKAAPNGYTMMLVTPTFVLTGLLYKDLAWDVQKSFAPISHTSSAPYVFYVHPALPVRNLQEYMAHAKANPGVLNMGTSGAGSINHVGGEWLHSLIGARATFVHYKTSPLLLTDMLSGRIQGSISSIPFVKSHVAAGKFKLTNYTNTVVPDAVLEMTSQYHSQGSRNYGKGNFPEIDALVEKAIGELNPEARTQLLDEFQTRFMNDWMLSFVINARPVRRFVAGNIGGYDKVAGFWNQYSANVQVGRWYYVDK